MDLFFNLRNKYTVNDTFDNVKAKVEEISISDFSQNFKGELIEDGVFKFTLKSVLSMTALSMLQSIAYLEGRIEHSKDGVVINTKAHPNYAVVVGFYGFVFVLIYNLCDLITFGGHYQIGEGLLLQFFFIFFILLALMLFVSLRLRKKFERGMKLVSDKSMLQ